MSDDRQVYSDEEFALILRKAAELAEPATRATHLPVGLTLAEMQAAAAQAGFDPALVQRAARLLRANAAAKPSFMERLIGGRTRHGTEDRFPMVLNEAGAAELLSAIRIGIGRSGEGHSGPAGVTWRTSDDGGGVLTLTALADPEGTSVKVELDRRGTLLVGGSLTLVASSLALIIGASVAGEIGPAFEPIGGLSGASLVVVLARSYWASATRMARERLASIMEYTSRLLAQSADTAPDRSTAMQDDHEGLENGPVGEMS